MDVEKSSPAANEELEKVLFSGREYTKPGAVIGNCLLLFGSNEGNCSLCTKPCLHPLASQDLIAFFHDEGIIAFDWIDDSACIMVCKDPSVVASVVQNRFSAVASEESGIIWYKSLDKVEKLAQEDQYGEKGEGISIYARYCLSSDIEHKKELQQAKIVNRIIKKRREMKKKREQMALKVVKKRNKKRRQRLNRKNKKEQEKEKEETSAK